MNKDNEKNTVDLQLKSAENIIDIEDLSAEYVQDEEFEKLIRDGLDSSWEDLGLSVSDDLIAKTMKAIKEQEPAKAAEPAGKQEPASVTRIVKFNRFAKVAAGVAAALLLGVVGLSVARGGLFVNKSADSSAMVANEAGGSGPTVAAANDFAIPGLDKDEGVDYFIDYTTAGAESTYGADADSATGGNYLDQKMQSESTADTGSVLQNYAPQATADEVMDRTADNGVLEKSESAGEDNEEDAAAPTLIDVRFYGFKDEEQYYNIINYLESVRGEYLGSESASEYVANEDEILISVAWPLLEPESTGIITVCDVYRDRLIYSYSSYLDHVKPSLEVDKYALEDGEAVATELNRLLGNEE